MGIEVALKDTILNAVGAALSDGSLEIYTENYAILLGVITLPNPAFDLSVNGAMEVNATGATTAIATGSAGSWIVKSSAGVAQWKETGIGAVSGTTGGGLLKLAQADTSIVNGQTLAIASWSFGF